MTVSVRAALVALRQQATASQQARLEPPTLGLLVLQMPRPDIPPVSPQEEELQQLYKSFNHAFATDAWQDLDWRDWRRVPWVLWYGKDTHMPAVQTGFLARLWVELADKPAALKRLIYVFLRDFTEHRLHINAVARFLVEQLAKAEPASILYRWQQIQQRTGLFTPQQAIPRLARECLQQDAGSVLGNAGLSAALLSGGYAEAVYRHALKLLPQEISLHGSAPLQQILAWSVVDDAESGPRLRYPDSRRELIHDLLLPWQRQALPAPLQALIRRFLLRYPGHPGIETALWDEVRPPAVKTFHRWLADSQLALFTLLCAEYGTSRHWRSRMAFWQHYRQRQAIDAAWLILDDSVLDKLRRDHPDWAAECELAAGRWETAQPGQAALLLRVQNVLVIDWLDGESWHLWLGKNPYLPRLFQAQYALENLRLHAESMPTDTATLARYIHQHAQIAGPASV